MGRVREVGRKDFYHVRREREDQRRRRFQGWRIGRFV